MNKKIKRIISSILAISMIGIVATSCQNNKYKDLGNEYVHGVDLDMSFDNPMRDRKIASNEDTYYYLGLRSGCYLTAINKETGKSSVLCNKPNCLHDKETDPTKTLNCNAFFYPTKASIFYFNNKIYILCKTLFSGNTNEETYSVYEVNIDGSGHKEIIKFKEFPYASIVHRGYLYMAYTDFMKDPDSYTKEEMKNLKYGVYRYDLSKPSKEREVVFEKKGKYGRIPYLTAMGNNMYISKDSEDENTIIYDIKKNKISERNDNYRFAVRQNDTLLNLKPQDTTIKVTDFDDNIKKEIPIEKTGVLYSNGNIIATDNFFEYGDTEEKRTVIFYDKNGKKIQEIDINNNMLTVLGMDEKYLFFYKDDPKNDINTDLCVIDLSKLGTEECKPEVYLHYDGDHAPPAVQINN